MQNKIRWGIVGTGFIAHLFAEGLSVLEDAELIAVSSRSKESAERFGDEFQVPHRHVGTQAIASDGAVDVVYVATPHPMHKEVTLACLDAGQAVLCEKPFAMNAGEARQMVSRAREKGVFLMEAMWTRFFPAMVRIRELLEAKAIGDIQLVRSDFCFRAEWNPQGRLLNRELGGGALLDVGVYNMALAFMVFQRPPDRIRSMAHIGPTGVDEQSSVILGYEGGAMAVSTCAIRTATPNEAFVFGTAGSIRIPHMFWQPDRIVVRTGEEEKELSFRRLGNGYNYEAAEVMRLLRSGELESPVIPLDESVAIMETMDAIRQQWGLVYPMEPS